MFHELEYKYKAESIRLEDFQNLMEDLKPLEEKTVSSWDYYFIRDEEGNDAVRFRNGSTPELTKKLKIKEGNNWTRIEVDLPLDSRKINYKTAAKYLELEGYKENFRIYKTCFIYWTATVNYVYYVVYDKNMKEKGRFIEVEVNKDQVVPGTEDFVVQTILDPAAKELERLGLSPQNRMRKSLLEIFRET